MAVRDVPNAEARRLTARKFVTVNASILDCRLPDNPPLESRRASKPSWRQVMNSSSADA